jgi:glycine cleavage system pyridoxal-binding protein P
MDAEGKEIWVAFLLNLENIKKRERGTSNICSQESQLPGITTPQW